MDNQDFSRAFLFSCLYIICATAYLNNPELHFSKDKIVIKNPGNDVSISRLQVKKLDSLGYPKEYNYIMTYVLIKRNNGAIPRNLKTTLFFNKRHVKYKWKVIPDPLLADYYYADTIKIDSNIWYEIGCAKCNYNYYFYWDSHTNKETFKMKSYPEGPF